MWRTLLLSALWGTVFGLKAQDAARRDNTPKYSNEFLQIGVSARALAMAGSMVAVADDATAGYWNPAGLARLQPKSQLNLMHASYFAGLSNYDFGAFATRLASDGVLAASVIRFSVDDIPDTRFLFDANGAINYDNIRFFSASDYGFLVSYGQNIKWMEGLKIGGSAKVIRRVVGDFATSWGFGVDVGAQMTVAGWNLGLAGRDIFGTFNSWAINDAQLANVFAQTGNDLYRSSLEVTLPRVILGVSRTINVGKAFSVLATADLVSTFDGRRNTLLRTDVFSVDPMAGLELGIKKVAFIRGGIGQFQQIKDFSGSETWSFQPNVGVGFQINELAIDYAFTDIGDQAAGLYSHVFTLKVDFNEK